MFCVVAPRAALAGDNDVVVRLSESGLNFVGTQLVSELPPSFAVPQGGTKLMDCPGTTPSELLFENVAANIVVDPKSVSVTAQNDGRFSIAFTVSSDGGGDVRLSRQYGCSGASLRCDISFSAQNGRVMAQMRPQINAQRLQVQDISVDMDLPDSNFQLYARSCERSQTLVNMVLLSAKSLVKEQVLKSIQEYGRKQLAPQMERAMAALGQRVRVEGQMGNYSVSAVPHSVGVDANGVGIGFGIGVHPDARAGCTLGSDAPLPPVSAPPTIVADKDHMLVSVSRRMLTQTLTSVWRGGLLCFPYERILELNLPSEVLSFVGIFLGMPRVTRLDTWVAAGPRVEFVEQAEDQVDLIVPDLRVVLEGYSATGLPARIEVSIDARLRMRINFDPAARSVVAEFIDIFYDNMALSAPAELGVRKAVIISILDKYVTPAIRAQLQSIVALPSVLHKTGGILDAYFLHATRFERVGDFLTGHVKIFRRPDTDRFPPTVNWGASFPRVVGKSPAFRLAGDDDSTPPELIRYRYRLDQGPWHPPDFSGLLRLRDLSEGQHVLEVRAIDLADNESLNSAKAEFIVDSDAPSLRSTGPQENLPLASFSVPVMASDNVSSQSQIDVRALLERVHASGADLVRDDGYRRGISGVVLNDLGIGEYALTLSARDEAGNVSDPMTLTLISDGVSVTITAGDAEHGGCAVDNGRASWSSFALAFCALLALCCIRRRR